MLRQPSDDKETGYIAGHKEIVDVIRKLAGETRDSAIFLVPTSKPLEEIAEILEVIARNSNFEKSKNKVKLLVPSAFDHSILEGPLFSHISYRKVDHDSGGVFISDKKRMLVFRHDNGASLITNTSTLQMTFSILDALWKESELRETGDLARRELIETLSREEKSRRQAQLLQDILTHDIRNYNQVTRLSAELLKEELNGNSGVQPILDSIVRAIDGSTEFLERAKRLGRAISEQNPRLYPVNLMQVIEKSIHLIRTAYPKKEIKFDIESILQITEFQRKIPAESSINDAISSASYSEYNVYADDLLGEVFSNIFSNCVKYTDGDLVQISVRLDKVEEDKSGTDNQSYWKLSITDWGHGIPDRDKANIFSRYLRGAKGIGLGMSIIHALVVERYGGRIVLKNRVEGDHTRGTIFEMYLKKI